MEARFRDCFGDNAEVTVFGEGYGGKIQSGGNYSPDESFITFDVLVRGADGRDWWLQYASMVDVCAKLELPFTIYTFIGTIHEAEQLVLKGFTSTFLGVANPEGLVGRPMVELMDRGGERVLVKLKRKDYSRISPEGRQL